MELARHARRQPGKRRPKILAWASVAVTAVLVTGVLGAYFAVRAKLGEIGHIQLIDTGHRPPRYTSALNILLLGSDTRRAQSTSLAGRNASGCNCSDTIMVVHVSPGRGKVTVLSIPRDTMIPVYGCSAVAGTPGQQQDLSQVEQFNWTLERGGPECTRHAVEQQTGIYINNVIQLNFTGFVKVINDVGGVDICVPFAVNDPIVRLPDGAEHGSGLKLRAGRQHIGGRTALRFWRARYALADGTDTARIARDQYLMAQVLKGVLRKGLLGKPLEMYRVLGDLAGSISTDASTSDLVHIATSLASLSTRHVQFVTAPYAPYPYPPFQQQLEFAQPQAGGLFSAVAHDNTLPRLPSGKVRGNTGLHPPTISPADVKVTVLNGSNVTGQAAAAAKALTGRGFVVLGVADAATMDHVGSVIEYGPGADPRAVRTLRGQFSSVTTRLAPTLARGAIQVVLGSSFSALAPPQGPTPSASVGDLSGKFNGITGNVGCRNSAFYGPNSPATASARSCTC